MVYWADVSIYAVLGLLWAAPHVTPIGRLEDGVFDSVVSRFGS